MAAEQIKALELELGLMRLDRDHEKRLRESCEAALINRDTKIAALRLALIEVDSCFEAALVEGWTDALANGDIEQIRDIYERRIAFARPTDVGTL